MSTLSVSVEPLAVDVTCTDEALHVVLADGREISVRWLGSRGSRRRRQSSERSGDSSVAELACNWEAVDEDISVESLLTTKPLLVSEVEMADDTKITKWHSMDEAAAKALTADTQAPHLLFPVPLSDLPSGIQKMRGLASAYVSHYVTTQPASGGVSAIGELGVFRTDSLSTSSYNFVFGVSSDGKVHFTGPRKDIPARYLRSSQAVPVASLFVGHPKRGAARRGTARGKPRAKPG
jgi:hypothetical protein